ncbi:MAG: Eco57I restriction-modification methylase domain-containing protein [Methanobrevibacter sp.]|jgi:hypothetical protein|nr:Eco57I restriction-modification methylase domain-containing protein [Candidatus Methanovirga meridionalis]
MDHRKAEDLLNELFDNKFNQNKFEEFLTELFNGFKPIGRKINFKKQYNEYIESVDYLGLHHDENNRENLAIYGVKLKKNSSRDRARVMQRNLIETLLDQYKRDAGIVAFYIEDQEDWRFSFVKVDYEIDIETINVKKTFSQAKRFSYLTGPYEPNQTCKSRFLKLLIDEQSTITISQIQEIFSVEKVTNEFFEKYQGLYKQLKESLNKIIKNEDMIREEFEIKNIFSSDFSKKLLGQIVFIYFLQKKGWLGVKYGEKWGTGSKHFFKETYQHYKTNQEKFKNFFDDILEPLFYKALNVERDRNFYEDLNCRIPFLNGGLFEPIKDYDWITTKIKLDDKIFEEIIETFDRFNFTVKEDEALDKEIAVDPEMLGKVFENLIDSDDRKVKGAFYTPREIVHYISQKTLINYLKNNSKLDEELLTEFIEKGYKLLDNIIRHEEQEKAGDKNPFWNKHLTILTENSEVLIKLLNDVKIVDTSVGSDAFPVGMMNEIVNAKTVLLLLREDEVNNYEIKREIIENSLYGVDIEYSAIDIAKLRFWLSLVIDEESMDKIRPLPNLDNKLMCGNSLIEEFNGIKLFDKNLLNKSSQTSLDSFYTESQTVLNDLRKLHKKFFNVESPNKKRTLREEINSKEWSLIKSTLKHEGKILDIEEIKKTNSKPFFIWELYFFEVFQRKNPGFDIVIGNPPYVRQEKIKKFKPYFKEHYTTYTGVTDLYGYFFEKGLNILKERGNLGFISSNKYTRANYGKKLREFLLNYNIRNYNDYTGKKVFTGAAVDTSVIIINKSNPKTDILVNDDFIMDQNRLGVGSWSFESEEILNLKDKIMSKGTPLKEIHDINIYRGISTGFNEAFILNQETQDDLIAKDSKNSEIIKPLLRGRDIRKWSIGYQNLYIIFSRRGIDIDKYPFIKEYLNGFKEKLTPKNKGEKIGRASGSYKWYELQNATDYYEEFERPKIIWLETAKIQKFIIDTDNYYLDKTCFFLPQNQKYDIYYLLTLFNSKVLFFIMKSIFSSISHSISYSKISIEQLPIIIAPKEE